MKQKKRLSPPLFFCGFVTVASLGGMALAACFQKVQGNWIAFAYPTALILLGWDCFQEHPARARWVKIGLVFSLVLTTLFILFPSFTTTPSLAPYAVSYRYNPFRHNMGWSALQQTLAKLGYDPAQHFLASDKYQTTSILSFYGVGQKRGYFLNLNDTRNNQFSYWPSLQEKEKGKTGFFVWVENMPHLQKDWQNKRTFYQHELENYFEAVELVAFAPLIQTGSQVAKGALIFRCTACKDRQFSESTRY